jgi:hypothetical protein
MKPNDKITVEITLAELAKIYAVMANATGTSSFLHALADKMFDGVVNHEILSELEDHIGQGAIRYHMIEEEWLDSLFSQETEQQKRIRELKETIAKVQQQIEELEISDEH